VHSTRRRGGAEITRSSHVNGFFARSPRLRASPETPHGTATVRESDVIFTRDQRPLADARGSVRRSFPADERRRPSAQVASQKLSITALILKHLWGRSATCGRLGVPWARPFAKCSAASTPPLWGQPITALHEASKEPATRSPALPGQSPNSRLSFRRKRRSRRGPSSARVNAMWGSQSWLQPPFGGFIASPLQQALPLTSPLITLYDTPQGVIT